MPAPETRSDKATAANAYRIAEQRIAKAAKEGHKVLELSDLGLTTLPPAIAQLNNLDQLNLINNLLTTLPPELFQLGNLAVLHLGNNLLTTLPPAFGQLTKLYALALDKNRLTRLPIEIGQLTELRSLNLSNNKLTGLPTEIGRLTKLSALYLNNNELTRLPAEIGHLNKLIVLDLDSNQLTNLPPQIGQLVNLTVLHIAYNGLTKLPPQVGHLAPLSTLHLGNNRLTRLPPEIGQLANLTLLYLSYNQLTHLPWEIGQLTKLSTLNLSNNQLTTLPSEICNLINLVGLNLHHNHLTTLPPEIGRLAKLDSLLLSNNRLTSLPEGLRQLSQLQSLFLHGNRKLQLPSSVLGVSLKKWNFKPKDGPAAGPILDYYFRTRRKSERRALCEGKLILVGRGDVGKTSLVRRLVDNTFYRREDTTQGIRIRQLEVIAGRKKDRIQMHVWDFGGQEIMHATHQLFLTDRSLYLLVLDGRAGQQEAEADYWLRLIASFAPESPVLVVLNKIKKDHFALNRGALLEKFPQVAGFVETDCDNAGADKKPGKDGHGITELRKAIAKQVDQLADVRQPFPTNWFNIKEKITKRRKTFLTADEYRKLCADLGEADAGAQASLSTILHRLGIALNFCDDPRVHDKHILNPHWLTTGIYSLLNSKTLAARTGEFTPADLIKELDNEKYPAEMHPFLIRLMEKFELCFSFDEPPSKHRPKTAGIQPGNRTAEESLASRYLIPELLDPEQPDATKKFEPNNCLNFLYQYPVLPPGLLPRFIVRTHVLSESHRWKTGVILNFEGNTALIKADPQEKTIRILINGPGANRRRMLGVIRQDFEVIHRDLPHLNPQELVSFPESPQVTVSYEELEVLYRDDPSTSIKRVVGQDVITATVRELLGCVEFAPLEETLRLNRSKGQGALGSSSEFAAAGLQPLRVFYSYSRNDARHRLRLSKSLALLERLNQIVTWYDNEILPGAEFDQEISDKLNSADIILLLISDDFKASNYCNEVEIPAAMNRHQEAGAVVIPIIIRETHNWENIPAGDTTLGKLNALPSSGKAVHDWKPKDKGWANIAAGIQRVVEEMRGCVGDHLWTT